MFLLLRSSLSSIALRRSLLRHGLDLSEFENAAKAQGLGTTSTADM